jgi:kinesin family protein C1
LKSLLHPLIHLSVQEVTAENRDLTHTNRTLGTDLDRARNELHTISTDLRQVRRDHERETADTEKKYQRDLADAHLKNEKELLRFERERERAADRHARELEEEKKAWLKQKDQETADMTSQHWDEMEELRVEHTQAIAKLQKELDGLRQAGESRATETAGEVQTLRESLTSLQSQLDANNVTMTSLRDRLTTYEAKITTLEQEKLSLVSKAHFLEGNQEMQSQEFTSMSQKLQDAVEAREIALETLRKEEAVRRKLNATILELRGNIRVFVRTRPLLNDETDPCKMDLPDADSLDGCKEMVVHAPTTQTATGKQVNNKHNYAFDRVFSPGTPNLNVFQECQDLIQSVVDGYNVSILSYGQTGSGKTYGMSGPDGIIPSSTRFLMSEMSRLKEKGWEYAIDASFVEVYNETINDLLGDAKTWENDEDAADLPLAASTRSGRKKEKHTIHHDDASGKTTVTGLTSISLWPPPSKSADSASTVEEDATYTTDTITNLLDTAAKNRRVAATKANERSSRSHSIFILTLRGNCPATGESSEGILNLVDLAGSERLKQSGAEGNRMKETQAINKSLSALGDVIASLGARGGGSGNGEGHVPYRNSKVSFPVAKTLLATRHVLRDVSDCPCTFSLTKISSSRISSNLRSAGLPPRANPPARSCCCISARCRRIGRSRGAVCCLVVKSMGRILERRRGNSKMPRAVWKCYALCVTYQMGCKLFVLPVDYEGRMKSTLLFISLLMESLL